MKAKQINVTSNQKVVMNEGVSEKQEETMEDKDMSKEVILKIKNAEVNEENTMPNISVSLKNVGDTTNIVDIKDVYAASELEQSLNSLYSTEMVEYIEELSEIIEDISSVLNISMGEIELYEPSEMPTPTTAAAISNTADSIMLNVEVFNPDRGIEPYQIFSLANVIRMSWQQWQGNLNLLRVKSANDCSISEYNSQKFQIDAHAFAYLYLLAFYDESEYDKVDGFFLNLVSNISSDEANFELVTNRIMNRAKYILRTEPNLF